MLRIVKKSEITKSEGIKIRVISVILSLIVVGIFIAILGLDPLNVYMSMIKGAIGSDYKIKQTIIKAIPLLIASLGISVAFRMKFWNIGGEGQILIGAFLSSFVALNFSNLPSIILLTIMIIAGIIGGGIWAFIPAFFESKFGTNETILTLMMNYIAFSFITYLQYDLWKDPKEMGFPKIANFTNNAILPKVLGIHMGWIMAILLVIAVYIFMEYTKKGYEISVLGESEKTAKYAGINIKRTILSAVFLSGGLCGLVGMIQASAINNTLSIEVAGGVGYTAIIIAWLSALKAPIIMIISILFAALTQGGSYIQTVFGIPDAAALVLQGTILFFVLGSEFFVKYKVTFREDKSNNKVAKEV
ncbi:ABC transporter permease [Clostridium botulinum D/C]|uniref:ABC transporter permease n=1 Tax=Clostridium botulinum TaxID=1491 RepID=UPI001E5A54EB|nr:ABC transporter permease [Clostridium botulinum]MCD3350937.1 ABC transporter permease [Clostridium botulinum D/C]MCD3359893.1 ABC transporter permease [Clostridium botulinum D/C]MCD3362189.1 ABC transporter permease [Clostridium botulinum D/C]MCD3365655.1 ABC transporter permease [Clostridium botulinum D/C]